MTLVNPAALKIALAKVSFLAPDRVTDDTSVLTLKNLVFEPLCRWQDGKVGPGLFARWTHTPDGRTWHFHIREKAVFHDGRPCTAGDVIAFIEQLLRAVDTFGMPWPYARYLAGCQLSAAAPDCVELVAPSSFGDVVDVFSEFYPCRVAADGTAVIGTGPYRVAGLEQGRSCTLERVAAGAAPQRLHVVACALAEDRLRLLQAGDCDVALNLENIEARIDMHTGLQWLKQPNTLSVMSYLNCAQGLFRSPQARLAINLAVDSGLIVDELFGGLGIRSSTIVSPFHLGHNEAAARPMQPDPERAARLFDAAYAAVGHGPIVMRTPLTMPPKSQAVTGMVADMLRRIGVEVHIDVETDRPAYARQLGARQMGDVAIFDSSPHSSFRILNDKISSTVRGTWWQGYHNPTVEAAIVRANASLGDVERGLAYGACLAELHRGPPWLYLFHPVEVMAARHGVPGLALDHKGILKLPA